MESDGRLEVHVLSPTWYEAEGEDLSAVRTEYSTAQGERLGKEVAGNCRYFHHHPPACSHSTPNLQRRDEVSKYLEADLAEFKQLQKVVETYLNDNKSSKANEM